jgi:hypothetical protein
LASFGFVIQGAVDRAFVPHEIRQTLEQADDSAEHCEVVIAHAVERLAEDR